MTLTGRAAVFGVNGAIAYTGVAAPSAQVLQSAELTDNFDLAELKSQVGEIIGLAKTNHRREFKIDFVPSSDGTSGNNTLANARLSLKLPTPLSQVVTSGFDHADYNGNWTYIGGGTISVSGEGYCKMTLPLRQYDTDITTAVS